MEQITGRQIIDEAEPPYPPRCNPETICDNGAGVRVTCYCCYGYQSKLCYMSKDSCNKVCKQPPSLSIIPNS